MDLTINIIWVIIATVTLLFTVVASLIKSSRESEKFEIWLKTHEKEIDELKKINNGLNTEMKILRESINTQNLIFNKETRIIEASIANLANNLVKTNLMLELILKGTIKHTNSDD